MSGKRGARSEWKPNLKWFRYADIDAKDEEAKAELVQYVLNSSKLTAIVHTYIDEQLESLERADLTEDAFDNPNWQNKQAFHMGKKAALKSVREFLPPNLNRPTEKK